ncbi:hypothetical protein BJV77DRAFT_531314 [Russula vinacea]|nr:hypothetical protein BJV77DRAFT_531314 [Russula vinacea]
MLRGNRLHYRCSHCLGTLYGRLRLRPLRFYSFIKTPKVNAPDCTAMCMLCLVNRVQLALNPLNDWIYGNSVQKPRRFFPAKFSMLSSLFPPSTCASHLPSSIIVKSCCHSTRLTPNTISFAICFLSPQPRLCSARLDPYLIIVPCTQAVPSTWNILLQVFSGINNALSMPPAGAFQDDEECAGGLDRSHTTRRKAMCGRRRDSAGRARGGLRQ